LRQGAHRELSDSEVKALMQSLASVETVGAESHAAGEQHMPTAFSAEGGTDPGGIIRAPKNTVRQARGGKKRTIPERRD
jgi:hypothetical protein